MNRTGYLLGVVLICAAAVARSAPQDDPIAGLSSDDLARGKRMFTAHCAVCHGIEGTGGRGPSLNQPKLRRVSDDRALFKLIQNGVDGSEMPAAWQLTDREVWQVAGYVRSVGRTAPSKLPGEPEKGRQLFAREGCASCHIVRGEGGPLGPELTDVGAARSPAYLREALTDPGASVPEGFLVVSVKTRDGKTVRGLRANEDSFTIQLRDARGRFQSLRKLDLVELKKEFGTSTMPSYRDVFTASELDDLVAYLAGLRGAQ
jgi:cytochrome c oxidase cbb3-type subunit 3